MTESVCKDIGHAWSLGKFFRMDSESDDATDCNAKAGSSLNLVIYVVLDPLIIVTMHLKLKRLNVDPIAKVRV